MSTLLQLIDEGKTTRAAALLTERLPELVGHLATYDGLQGEYAKLLAMLQIRSHEPLDFEWPDTWGPKPTPRSLLYADFPTMRDELHAQSAALLDAIVAVVRTPEED